MDSIIFITLLLAVPIGIGLLLYFVPKKLGYAKTAKYLLIAYVSIIVLSGLFIVFEDQLFTKSNAKELIEEQGFKLTDQFDLLKNESMTAPGDYYHTFTLKISERDKQDAISKIIRTNNFKVDNNPIEDITPQGHDRYFGKKMTKNYETEKTYVREYFEPSGRKGYAPTFRRITISKTDNELVFEDIDE